MDHALAQILRRGRSSFVRKRHRVCLSVMVHHQRMIDGDIGYPLIEVLDRIAAILHDGSHETVGFFERAVGIIDESSLHNAPALGVALARLGRKRPYLELRPPLLASPQLALRLAPIVEHPHGPVVLRSETLLQRSGPLALDHHPDQPRDGQYPDRDQDPHPCVHDGSPSSRTVRSSSPGSYPFAARGQTRTSRATRGAHEMQVATHQGAPEEPAHRDDAGFPLSTTPFRSRHEPRCDEHAVANIQAASTSVTTDGQSNPASSG